MCQQADLGIEPSLPAFLSGGGEMGKLIRSIDWSHTTLGNPISWPQALKTSVRIMLDTPFGMYIAWGEEYVQLYNDGYRPILGVSKHPHAMGNTTRETFAEIWDIIGPMFEGVMLGNAVGFPDFVLHLDRNGFTEECIFDFSYSPIRLDNGEVGGVLVTVIETTEKVRATNALKESEEQLKFAVEAANLGTWDFNHTTNQIKANDRLKEWFGFKPGDEIELSSAKSAIKQSDQPLLIQAIEKALQYSSGGGFDITYSIINPWNGGERIVRAKGRASFDENKTAYRFNGTVQDVTEEVIARRLVTKSNEQLRNLVQNAPVAMCVLRGPTFVVELANARVLEIWGKTAEQMIQHPVFDAMPDAASQGLEELLHAVYTTGESFIANELPLDLIRYGRSEKVFLNFVYEPLYEYDGTISGVVAVATDVTEQVNSRKKIEEKEAQLRIALEGGELGTYDFHPQTQEINWSDKTKELFGLTPNAEVNFDNYQLGLHPDDLERLQTEFNKVMKSPTNSFSENEFRTIGINDGKIRWIRSRGKISYDGSGNVIRFTGTIQDITLQKTSEQAIRESENRFRTLAETLPQMIWVRGMDGVIEYASKNWEEYTGIKDLSEAWKAMIHPEDWAPVMTTWQKALTSATPFQYEVRLKNKEGEYRWHYAVGEPVIDQSGMAIKYIGSLTDIHVQKTFSQKLERLVKERTAELERSNEDLQQFAHVASHDLKEPLRKIKIFGSRLLIEQQESLNEIGRQYLNKIEIAANRMYDMIDGVLLYSSLNATQQLIDEVDLNVVLNNVKEDLEVLIQQKQALLKISQLPVIHGSGILLHQLFYNLVNNALKFSSPERKPLIYIYSTIVDALSMQQSVSRPSTSAYLQIVIEDNGIGFDQSQVEKIFKTFTRLNSKDMFEGTGLGLSLCKKIVERHRGTITATAKDGEGANFILMLPLDQGGEHI